MDVNFKYDKNTTYFLNTNSNVSIFGDGIWEVDEESFRLEYLNSKKSFEKFLEDYFESDLDLDTDFITFNGEDFDKLKEYCNETD